MLTILSTLISFLMGGLPKLLDFFQDRNDKKHELALAAMQIERELELRKAGFEAQERVEQIHSAQLEMETTAKATENLVNAQVAEMSAIYKHDESLGDGTSQWMKDLRAGVRSFITMGFFFLLCFVDAGLFIYGYNHGVAFPDLAEKLWNSNTQALFASIIAFHFGGRAFGK
jgi:hypothetical protein